MCKRLAEEHQQGNRVTRVNIDERETPYLSDPPGAADQMVERLWQLPAEISVPENPQKTKRLATNKRSLSLAIDDDVVLNSSFEIGVNVDRLIFVNDRQRARH